MRITGPGNLSGVQTRPAAKRGEKKTGSAFSPDSPSESARAESSGGAGAVYGVDALLALQAVEDPLTGRRKAARRGHDLLDALDSMHVALLSGNVPVDRLERIASLLAMRQPSDDPTLEALVDDIELRAKVELAKLGRFLD